MASETCSQQVGLSPASRIAVVPFLSNRVSNGRIKVFTLLTYPRLTASSGLLPRCFLHLCYDWSLCLAQLTPAYGVTSMCRFIQAATALSIDPTAVARCLCCHCGCSLFYSFGFLYSLLPPSRHIASACPHVNRHHSPALHPVFIQLVHTVCFCGR